MSYEMGDGLAYRIPAQGPAQEVDWTDRAAPRVPDTLDWIHLDATSEVAQRWLAERSGLDPIVVAALLEEETRPRCVPMAGGVLVILRGVNLNPGQDPEDMVSLRIWAEEGLVISARRRPLMAIRDLRVAVESGNGPRDAGELLGDLADRLIDRVSGVLSELGEAVDAVEEMLLDAPVSAQRGQLAGIRRQAIALRRYLAPQRDALSRLSSEPLPWIKDAQRVRLREITDTTLRYVEDLEEARERTAVTQEELNARVAEQMNRRMYALSVIAGIFLPLSFLTGLLGINVGGIPGTASPIAFALVCGALALIAGAQALVFRRLGWM